MLPKLAAAGLAWCNFQAMRRTHATLMRQLKADPKMVADQLGHSVDVCSLVARHLSRLDPLSNESPWP